MNIKPISFYNNSINKVQAEISRLTLKSKWISRVRLLLFILGGAFLYNLWGHWFYLIPLLIVIAILFLFFVKYNDHTDEELQINQNLKMINENEINHLNYKYQYKYDGSEYMKSLRLESNDLDLFGPGSLFQFINRGISDQGKLSLAKSLIAEHVKEEIEERQDAIKELSSWTEWRQLFLARQMNHPLTNTSQEILINWTKKTEFIRSISVFKFLGIILPILSIGIVWLYGLSKMSDQWFTISVLFILMIQGYLAYLASKKFKILGKISSELKSLSPCLQVIESKTFTSTFLKELASTVKSPIASKSIQSLTDLLSKYDYRLNPVVFIPLNFLTWFDIQLMIRLDRWQKDFNGNINQWYHALSEFEMLSSYATLAFNNPSWVYPELSDDWYTFDAKALGHPLIHAEKIVTNDFSQISPNHLALITGSNMAGKSTFLRSIGANMILAKAGSPVCALQMNWSAGKCLTSMRISDNLQEETSTFYAELKKIKIMLDAINSGEKVILLIDEMLRGTNTEDRKMGVHGFIKQLLARKAVGIIASHDTGIYEFSNAYPDQVFAYFFDSFIEHDQLKFDYKIKSGTVSSANASYLMRKIGIDI
ncbi:MAG: hypothetical protein ABI844_04390 [Saprospiraceae bacterium]